MFCLRPPTPMRESPVSVASSTPRPDTLRRTPPIPIPGGGTSRSDQIGSQEEAFMLEIQKELLPSVGMNVFSRFKLSKNENDGWTLSDCSSISNSSIYSLSDLYSYLFRIRDNNSECQTIIKLFNDKFSMDQAFKAWRQLY